MLSRQERSKFVHYGSHTTGPDTWLNFDASPTLRLQRLPLIGSIIRQNLPSHRPVFPPTVEYGDIVQGLPIQEGQCRAVYCSHILEHLALEECRVALRHTYKYLEPGGFFRFAMPDLKALASAYLSYEGDDAAHRFMERAWLGKQTRPRSPATRLISSLGNAAHLWMWDYASMQMELTQQGFVDIRRAEYNDSAEPRFADVEDKSRWEERGFDDTGVIPCLGVECRKP